jgi:hypothetical protein
MISTTANSTRSKSANSTRSRPQIQPVQNRKFNPIDLSLTADLTRVV